MINRAKAVWQFITSPDYSRTVSILALLVVVLAIPLTVFIAQKQQEIRQRAEGERVYCGRNGQPGIGVPVGACESGANGCTATKFTRYVLTTDANGDGVLDPADPGDQPWCDYVCAEPKTCPGIPTATPTPSTQILHPVGEISNVNPTEGNAGQQFTVQGHIIAATNDANNSQNYIVTKAELWVTKRGTPDQAPQNCPGPVAGIWCRIGFFEGESQHDAFITGQWTPSQAGNYLIVVNGFVKSGGKCTGNPVLPGGWEDCGRTGRRDMVELTAGSAAPPTVTLTPTSGPTGVTICGKDCYDFTRTSLRNISDCQYIDKYILDNGGYNTSTRICNFECKSVDSNYQPGPGGCGQRPIPIPTIGGCGDSCGPGDPVPQPTDGPVPTTAPTQPPGALTKLLFDLVLSGATKDKRIVAQIFTATPAAQIGQDLEGTVKRGPGGNFTGAVNVVNTITSRTYNIKVKAGKYLRKLIQNIQITKDTTARISQITLTLGDINGDNKLNISDYNILIDCFGNKANSQTCGNNKDLADLDDNERVDGVDYNLFLINLSKGPRDGD